VRSNGRVVWLWWWLGVLVASCSQSLLPGSTTQAPTPSLLSLTLPLATPTPILRLLRTPTVRSTGLVTATRAAATPLPLSIAPPTCYETPVGSLWCLGLIRNELSVPIDQIIMRVYLVNGDGTALGVQDARTARSILEPGAMSPYGILFDTVPDGTAGPVATLVSANQSSTQSTHFVSIKARDIQGIAAQGGYQVTGKLVNTAAVTVRQLSLVVTLFDDGGRVTGFRQLQWPDGQPLQPGESLSFNVDAIPQGPGTVRAEASAEGRSD
jgi:hypothetical protein